MSDTLALRPRRSDSRSHLNTASPRDTSVCEALSSRGQLIEFGHRPLTTVR